VIGDWSCHVSGFVYIPPRSSFYPYCLTKKRKKRYEFKFKHFLDVYLDYQCDIGVKVYNPQRNREEMEGAETEESVCGQNDLLPL
jgi:hypothetical protein